MNLSRHSSLRPSVKRRLRHLSVGFDLLFFFLFKEPVWVPKLVASYSEFLIGKRSLGPQATKSLHKSRRTGSQEAEEDLEKGLQVSKTDFCTLCGHFSRQCSDFQGDSRDFLCGTFFALGPERLPLPLCRS